MSDRCDSTLDPDKLLSEPEIPSSLPRVVMTSDRVRAAPTTSRITTSLESGLSSASTPGPAV